MPKDEFDFEDPFELNGVALMTDEDTSLAMAECFTEEFLRLGYNHKQLLAMFRNPHYLGLNMVLQNKGEAFVKQVIGDVFARWGRDVVWPAPSAPPERLNLCEMPDTFVQPAPEPSAAHTCTCGSGGCESAAQDALRDATAHLPVDPFGNPVPPLHL